MYARSILDYSTFLSSYEGLKNSTKIQVQPYRQRHDIRVLASTVRPRYVQVPSRFSEPMYTARTAGHACRGVQRLYNRRSSNISWLAGQRTVAFKVPSLHRCYILRGSIRALLADIHDPVSLMINTHVHTGSPVARNNAAAVSAPFLPLLAQHRQFNAINYHNMHLIYGYIGLSGSS